MANKVKLASERRKLALRGVILQNRARIASLQEQTRRAREELKTYAGRRKDNSVTPLPAQRVRI